MGSLSIRGVDDRLAALLKKKAQASNRSVNQFVLEALKRHVGLEKEERFTKEHHDLDHLFGTWSENEYHKIQDKIDAERQIDEELW